MLKAMRKKGNVKAVMWVLAIIIIPAFVFWGAGSMIRERSRGAAGTIFHKKVPLEDYLQSWEAARDQALMIYGRLFDQIAQYLDLDSQAWDRLILLVEARKQRIRVTDQELIERLRDFPLFQKEGKFDPQVYEWVLKYYFRTTPIRFEEQMRESIRISKLVEKIYAQVNLTEAQLKEEFVSANEKAKFSFFLIETKDLLNQVNLEGEKELLDYYNQHKETLRRPDSVKVEYASLDSSALESQVSVSDEEIKVYFEGHREEFKPASPSPSASPMPSEATQEEKKVAQNKEPIPAAKTDELKPELTSEIKETVKAKLISQKARDRVEEIKSEVVPQLGPQAKLEEIARKYSLSFKETGYFSLDEPIAEIGFNLKFYNAAFGLGAGEISEPIETAGGYLFLKVKEKKASYIPEFSEVKAKVGDLAKKEKAAKLAKEKAEALLKALKEKSWEDLAKESNLAPVTTDFITRQDYITGIGKSEEFIRTGFSLNPKEIAKNLIRTERGFVLLRLDEKRAINDDDFQKEKAGFKEKILAKKQADYFQAWFEALKKKANLQSNVDKMKQRMSP